VADIPSSNPMPLRSAKGVVVFVENPEAEELQRVLIEQMRRFQVANVDRNAVDFGDACHAGTTA
jgi:hypothetical protein